MGSFKDAVSAKIYLNNFYLLSFHYFYFNTFWTLFMVWFY